MSKVVVVRSVASQPDRGLKKNQYSLLIKYGLRSLLNTESEEKEIRTLFTGSTLGLKVNCLAGKLNSTPLALVEALSDILTQAGFKDNDILVWERQSWELEKAGYKLNASSFGRRCFGTDSNSAGYSSDFYSFGKANSLVSRILTDLVDSNINLPVLKDHSIAGLSGGLKNMFGAINNPNKYHGDNCSPYAAHVSNLEPIKQKNRLTIVDAARVQYNMGPGFDSRYLDNFGGIILSADPVAADTIALEILEKIRQKHNQPSLKDAGRPVKYLLEAEQIGLGTADIDRVAVEVIFVDEDGNASAGELF